jgi:hypothetical protein
VSNRPNRSTVCWTAASAWGSVGDVGFHHQRGAARLVDLGGEGF